MTRIRFKGSPRSQTLKKRVQACGISAPRRSSPRNGANVGRWIGLSTDTAPSWPNLRAILLAWNEDGLPCGNQRVGVGEVSRLPLVLGGVVIAARIIMHGAGMIAMCSAVGAGEVFDPIGEVGVGVAQPCGVAGVAEAAGGREFDLHQPNAAAVADQM